MLINLNRFNGILLFFMVCFPYISLVDTPFDSTIDRIVHIVVSHLSIFYSYGLGFGLGNWSIYAYSLVREIGGFASDMASVYMTTGSGRIMSGWGTAIFELGLIGVLFLGTFIYLMYLGYRKTTGELKSISF